MKNNKNINEKLKYLGLDRNDIPEILKQYESLEYKPVRNYDEKSYKTYRYLNVKDIKILLTPKNRLDNIIEKYKEALPIYAYIVPEKEDNIELYTKFLKMAQKLNIEDISNMEEEQKKLNKNIPFMAKYYKDYLWQVHYSEYTDQYFMLVPTEDQEQTAFFYLLKKQLIRKGDTPLQGMSPRENNRIFVPICYSEYSEDYLTRHEIEEIEKYMWLFTKDWPLIYEVYDKKNNLEMYITGKANIYENVSTDYSIVLQNKEETSKFYKLLKALFILSTELLHYYKFEVKLDKEGSLDFYYKDKKIAYQELADFIKQEYVEVETETKKTISDIKKLKKQLDKIKLENTKLELEYLNKEREITFYLECRKTFLGKVKYFFKKKKEDITEPEFEGNGNVSEEENIEADLVSVQEEIKNDLCAEFYTLEELVKNYKKLDVQLNDVKNLRQDIKAGKHKIKNMKRKIKNAALYLKEIDNHKKSIFEFWKFTNKDKTDLLVEAEDKESNTSKLRKVFDYNIDFESFAEELDKKQKEILSDEEINNIFIAGTYLLKDINAIASGEELSEERLEEVKKEVLDKKKLLEDETYDILGNIMSRKTKINMLSSKKHREIKREETRVLDINRNTDIKKYTGYVKEIYITLKQSINKVNMGTALPVYRIIDENQEERFSLCEINLNSVIKRIENMTEKEFTIERINLDENTKGIGFTNIIYYDNANNTLPLGMDEKELVLLDDLQLQLELINSKEMKIAFYEEDEFFKPVIKTITIHEYDA